MLELILVLGLISVLLAVGVAGHAALRGRLGLAAAAGQLGADLALARIAAITRNREQRLVFTPGSASYHRQERTDGRFEDAGEPRTLPAGVDVDDCTAPNEAISFRPQGGAGSFGTVVLGNASGEKRSVTVSITGRTRIQ